MALIEGFSIFCDWDSVDDPANGGVNLGKLSDSSLVEISDDELAGGSPQKKVKKTKGLIYFSKVLKREFSDNPEDLASHKYLIENFRVKLEVQINKNIKNPVLPATQKHPQLLAFITIGPDDNTG